jgi:micrococcal nuclease
MQAPLNATIRTLALAAIFFLFPGLVTSLVSFAPSELRRVISPAEMPSPVTWGVSSLNLIPPAQAASRSRWPGPFEVKVLDIKDGDTVDVQFGDGPCGRGPCAGAEVLIRILGVDAPEAHRCRAGKRGQAASGGKSCAACDAEHQLGRRALAFTRDLVEGRPARASLMRPDKYGGRVVAKLEVLKDGAWLSVADALLSEELAIAYDGGAKTKPWCARRRAS